MGTAILEPHHIVLSSGQEYRAEAHYRNVPSVGGLSMVYFETLSNDTPTVPNTEHYHTWSNTDGTKLTAWMVPESETESVIEIA